MLSGFSGLYDVLAFPHVQRMGGLGCFSVESSRSLGEAAGGFGTPGVWSWRNLNFEVEGWVLLEELSLCHQDTHVK